MDDITEKILRELKTIVVATDGGIALDVLKKVIRDCCKPKNNKFQMSSDSRKLIRTLAFRTAKTAPRKVLKSWFQWSKRNRDHAIIEDNRYSRWWVACIHLF